MGKHGSFTIPVRHYWSLPCVMVSDEGWCIPDRLHTELSPWLKSHYFACALNYNCDNHFKRLELSKNVSIQYSADLLRIQGAQCWQMTLHQLVWPVKKIRCFWLRMIIFSFDSSDGLWQSISPLIYSPPFCPSDVFLFATICLPLHILEGHCVGFTRRCQWLAVYQVSVIMNDYELLSISSQIQRRQFMTLLWISSSPTLSIHYKAIIVFP